MKLQRTLKFTQQHVECSCGLNRVFPMTTTLSWSKLRKESGHPKKQPDGRYMFFVHTYIVDCPGRDVHDDELEGFYDDDLNDD